MEAFREIYRVRYRYSYVVKAQVSHSGKKRYFQSFGFIYFSSATFKRLNAEKIKHYDYLFDNSCNILIVVD